MRIAIVGLVLALSVGVQAQEAKAPTPVQLAQSALASVQATQEWAALIKTPAWKTYQDALALAKALEAATKPKVEPK